MMISKLKDEKATNMANASELKYFDFRREHVERDARTLVTPATFVLVSLSTSTTVFGLIFCTSYT